MSSTFAQAKKPATEYRFRGKPEESQQGFYWRVALRKLQHPEPFTPLDLARKETADLLRKHDGKHSGKTGEELKAEAK